MKVQDAMEKAVQSVSPYNLASILIFSIDSILLF